MPHKKSSKFTGTSKLRVSWSDALHLFLAIVVAELAGVLGSFFTVSEIPNWYAFLDKPSFSPPNWVFAPVWTTLYALMGIALFLSCTYGKPAEKATTASYWFYAQLGVNVLWSLVFFGLHSLWGGVAVIVLLWLLIVQTMRLFYAVKPAAAWLLVPYLAWVSFASVLNISLALLN